MKFYFFFNFLYSQSEKSSIENQKDFIANQNPEFPSSLIQCIPSMYAFFSNLENNYDKFIKIMEKISIILEEITQKKSLKNLSNFYKKKCINEMKNFVIELMKIDDINGFNLSYALRQVSFFLQIFIKSLIISISDDKNLKTNTNDQFSFKKMVFDFVKINFYELNPIIIKMTQNLLESLNTDTMHDILSLEIYVKENFSQFNQNNNCIRDMFELTGNFFHFKFTPNFLHLLGHMNHDLAWKNTVENCVFLSKSDFHNDISQFLIYEMKLDIIIERVFYKLRFTEYCCPSWHTEFSRKNEKIIDI